MQAELPEYLPEPLRALARPVVLKRHQTLYRFDDPVLAIYFIRQGEMEAVRYTTDGEAMVMVRASDGDFFGEPALAVERYACAGIARADSELLAMPKAAVLAEFQRNPAFASAFLLAQVRNARRQCSRYERVRAPRRGSHPSLSDHRRRRGWRGNARRSARRLGGRTRLAAREPLSGPGATARGSSYRGRGQYAAHSSGQIVHRTLIAVMARHSLSR